MSCLEAFDSMCRKIVSPTRHDIQESEMIERKFRSSHVKYSYLEVSNKQSQKLSVIVFGKDFKRYPTVLYLHGNGGHKLQSLQIANEKINLIAFDFSGCGKSEGQFITYGEKEVEDISCVVEKIKGTYSVSEIALWGRSMGASLAIMFASRYPNSLSALILDTPFRFLRKVVHNVATQNERSIPGFLIDLGIFLVQKKTNHLVGADIFEHDFQSHLSKIKLPILFAYSTRDTVVREEDVKELFDSYNKAGKQIFQIQSLHHQDRPKNFIHHAYKFILKESHSAQNLNDQMPLQPKVENSWNQMRTERPKQRQMLYGV